MVKIIDKTRSVLYKQGLRQAERKGLGKVEFGVNQRVLDYSRHISVRTNKIALLCYLTQPIADELAGQKTVFFSNVGAVRSIAKVLNELGYVVDVINWDDTDFKPKKGYDLYFLHGGIVYSGIKNSISKDTKLIYYSTGSYWKYHNEQELFRFEDFKKRHKAELKPDRFIRASEEEVNKSSDLIISLGNKDAAKTYSKFNNVVNLEGASIPDNKKLKRDYLAAKKHFLFLAGPGNIHKGLDLLLDSFSGLPERHLHVVGTLDSDFEKYYYDLLYKSKNIHTYGYVPQRSKKYYSIVKQCSASILPSCSEGSPGSVIESMEQGLIPIVSKQSHIDIDNNVGVILHDCKIQTIKNQVNLISGQNVKYFESKANAVKNYVRKEFTVDKYESKLRTFITKLESQK